LAGIKECVACLRIGVIAALIMVLAACASSSNAPIARAGTYTVKKGDTLYSIGKRYNRNTRDLVAWNKLPSASQIEVGQVLVLNAPAGMRSTAPATRAPATTRAPAKTAPKPAPAQTKTAKDRAIVAANAENINWMWPATGTRRNSSDKNKKGVDIVGTSGQPIMSAAAGKVIYSGRGIRGYGDMVIVKHSNAWLSVYAHNKTLLVKEGQNVKRGEKIAEMGNTDSPNVKLYFELRRNGDPLNPTAMMPK
jgi:lipoprotein NlpD